MCLAIPACVVAILDSDTATVDVGGITKQISITLLPGLQVGDYVLVHVGFAISRIDAREAQATLSLLADMAARS